MSADTTEVSNTVSNGKLSADTTGVTNTEKTTKNAFVGCFNSGKNGCQLKSGRKTN